MTEDPKKLPEKKSKLHRAFKAILDHKILIVLLLINLIIICAPAFIIKNPYTQFDAAAYYALGYTWDKTGDYNANLPNVFQSGVEKVSDYPPLLPLVLKYLIKYSPSQELVMKGLYFGLLFVVGNLFLFLFVRKLLDNRLTAYLTLIFSMLNVRAYYQYFGGMWAFFISFCFMPISLYYALIFFREKKIHALILTLFILALVSLLNTIAALFLIALIFMLYIGYLLKKKLTIKWPLIKWNIDQITIKSFKPLLLILIPTIIVLAGSAYLFIFSSSAKTSWLSDWFTHMIQSYLGGGYQVVWKYFFILDGPIVTTLGLIGFVYSILKKKWELSALMIGGFIVYISQYIFIDGNNWLLHYIYNFYLIISVLIFVAASDIFSNLLKSKKVRTIGVILLILCLGIQIAKFNMFTAQLHEGFTDEELEGFTFLRDYNNNKIYFWDNKDTFGFRSMEWGVIYSGSFDNYYGRTYEDHDDTELIYISDKQKIDKQVFLEEFTPVYEKDNIIILERSDEEKGDLNE